MQTEAETTELLALLDDTREHIAYFKELGVEGLEKASQSLLVGPLRSSETENRVMTEPAFLSSTTEIPVPAARISSVSQEPAPTTLFGDLISAPVRIPRSTESFEDIWADIGNCTRCPLYERRTNIVHTDGNRNARLMFVGEAPGADEDALARPFVGRAGQLLTKIIEAIGFKREEVLIGNVNRCRPPGNRPPTPDEAAMCKPFLLREIAAVQPDVIVVLGNTAMKNLLDLREGITKVRGKFQDYHGVKVMPTFHPAYLLRDPSKKRETWEDLKKVRDYLDSTRRHES
ncbi:MAG TPA: uracil-DNA glycosylase [Pyrinomonadaceae bacterium]|nr:uracil-DNA glycosylase [Pyrinomonadaceae bacterium]